MGISPPCVCVCVCVCGLISSPNLSSFNVASIPDRRSPRDACLSLPRKPKQQTPATWPVLRNSAQGQLNIVTVTIAAIHLVEKPGPHGYPEW
jgi:hypothetical protein